jgi:hypothetical protein
VPNVLAMTSIDGRLGQVNTQIAVDCYFREYKIGDQAMFTSPQDNIFLRHTSLFLLDKYFRACGLYKNRHISIPLGEKYKDNSAKQLVPTGMVSEFVYGTEASSFYNEHLDWNEVSKAFGTFGFTRMDHDLYSGFYGEDNSFPHNFFSQSDLYPEEKQCVFTPPVGLSHIPKRYATARWMRIDYMPDSFPCEEKKLIGALKSSQVDLQKKLSPDEFYFLNQYGLVLENKKLENDAKFDGSIKNIRQANLLMFKMKNRFLQPCLSLSLLILPKILYQWLSWEAKSYCHPELSCQHAFSCIQSVLDTSLKPAGMTSGTVT